MTLLASSGGKPSLRRVTVMMMNSHQHIELVEVRTHVIMGGTVDNVEFKCDVQETEKMARVLMERNLPATVDVSDFNNVGILVSCTHGMLVGRIVWAKEATIETRTSKRIT
jgi:hypothetical protein